MKRITINSFRLRDLDSSNDISFDKIQIESKPKPRKTKRKKSRRKSSIISTFKPLKAKLTASISIFSHSPKKKKKEKILPTLSEILPLKITTTLINDLYDQFIAEAFREPVDWEKFELFDYLDVVTEPMDLGTVKTRLESGYYCHDRNLVLNSTDELIDSGEKIVLRCLFVSDVFLTFDNCIKYNGENTPIGLAAQDLKEIFTQSFVEQSKVFDEKHDFFNLELKEAEDIGERSVEETEETCLVDEVPIVIFGEFSYVARESTHLDAPVYSLFLKVEGSFEVYDEHEKVWDTLSDIKEFCRYYELVESSELLFHVVSYPRMSGSSAISLNDPMASIDHGFKDFRSAVYRVFAFCAKMKVKSDEEHPEDWSIDDMKYQESFLKDILNKEQNVLTQIRKDAAAFLTPQEILKNVLTKKELSGITLSSSARMNIDFAMNVPDQNVEFLNTVSVNVVIRDSSLAGQYPFLGEQVSVLEREALVIAFIPKLGKYRVRFDDKEERLLYLFPFNLMKNQANTGKYKIEGDSMFSLNIPAATYLRIQEVSVFLQLCKKATYIQHEVPSLDELAASLFIRNFKSLPKVLSESFMLLLDTLTKFSLQDISDRVGQLKGKNQNFQALGSLPKLFYGQNVKTRYGLQLESTFLNWIFHKISIPHKTTPGISLKFKYDAGWLKTNLVFIEDIFQFYCCILKWDPGFAPRISGRYVDLEKLFLLVIFKGGYFYIRGKDDEWAKISNSMVDNDRFGNVVEELYKYYLLEYEIYKMKTTLVLEKKDYFTLPELEFKGLNTISNRSDSLHSKSAFFDFLLEKFPSVDMSQDLNDIGQIHDALEEWLTLDKDARKEYLLLNKTFVFKREKLNDTATICRAFNAIASENNNFSHEEVHSSWEKEDLNETYEETNLISHNNWLIVLDMVMNIFIQAEKQDKDIEAHKFGDILGEYDLLEEENQLFEDFQRNIRRIGKVNRNEEKVEENCMSECILLVESLLTHPMLKLESLTIEDDNFEEKLSNNSTYWNTLFRLINDHYSPDGKVLSLEGLFRDIRVTTKALNTGFKSKFDDNYFTALLQEKFEHLSSYADSMWTEYLIEQRKDDTFSTLKLAIEQGNMNLAAFLLVKQDDDKYENKNLGVSAALTFLSFVSKVDFSLFVLEKKRTRKSRPVLHFSGKQAYIQEVELRVRGGNYGKVDNFDFNSMFSEVQSFLEETTGIAHASDVAIGLCKRCAVFLSTMNFPEYKVPFEDTEQSTIELLSPTNKNLNSSYKEKVVSVLSIDESSNNIDDFSFDDIEKHCNFLSKTLGNIDRLKRVDIVEILFEDIAGAEYLKNMDLLIVDIQSNEKRLRRASITEVFDKYKIAVQCALGRFRFDLQAKEYGDMWCISIDINAVNGLMNIYGDVDLFSKFGNNCHMKKLSVVANSDKLEYPQYEEIVSNEKNHDIIPEVWIVDDISTDIEHITYTGEEFLKLGPNKVLKLMEKLVSEILDIGAFRSFVNNEKKPYKKRKKQSIQTTIMMTRSQTRESTEVDEKESESELEVSPKNETEDSEIKQLKRKAEQRELRSSTRKRQKILTVAVDVEALIFSLTQKTRKELFRLGYKSVIASATESDFIPFCTARKLYQLNVASSVKVAKSSLSVTERYLHQLRLSKSQMKLEEQIEQETMKIIETNKVETMPMRKRKEKRVVFPSSVPTTPKRIKPGFIGESKSSFFEYCVVDVTSIEIPVGTRFGEKEYITFKDSSFPKGVVIESIKLSPEHPMYSELSLLRVGDRLLNINEDVIGEGMYDASFVNNFFTMSNKQSNNIKVTFEIYRSIFLNRLSTLKRVELSPIPFYDAVKSLGGYDNVVENLWWQKVRKKMKLPHATSSGFQLRKSYLTYFSGLASAPAPSSTSLIPFEKPYPFPKEVTDRNLIAKIKEAKDVMIRKLPVTPKVVRKQKAKQGDILPNEPIISSTTYDEALVSYMKKLPRLEEEWMSTFVDSFALPKFAAFQSITSKDKRHMYKVFHSNDITCSTPALLVRFSFTKLDSEPEISVLQGLNSLYTFVNSLDRSEPESNELFKQFTNIWPLLTLNYRTNGDSLIFQHLQRQETHVVKSLTVLSMDLAKSMLHHKCVYYIESIDTTETCDVSRGDILSSIDDVPVNSSVSPETLKSLLKRSHALTFITTTKLQKRILSQFDTRDLKGPTSVNPNELSVNLNRVIINSSLFVQSEKNQTLERILAVEEQLFKLSTEVKEVEKVRKRWRWLHSWGSWQWASVRPMICELKKDTKHRLSIYHLQILLEMILRAYISSLPPVHDICFLIEDEKYILNREYAEMTNILNLPTNEYLSVTLENAPLEEQWIERVKLLKTEEEALFLCNWLYYEGVARIISAKLVEQELKKGLTLFNQNIDDFYHIMQSNKLGDDILWHGPAKVNSSKEKPALPSPKKDRRRSGRMLQKLRSSPNKFHSVDLPIRESGKEFLVNFEKLMLIPTNELLPKFNGIIRQRVKFDAVYKVRKGVSLAIGSYDTATEAAFAHDIVLLLMQGKEEYLNFSKRTLVQNLKHLPPLFSFWEELEKYNMSTFIHIKDD